MVLFLTAEAWRCCRRPLLPLLAALFSAIGALRATPDGFLLGTLLPLPKGVTGEPGYDPAEPLCSRPITLLNSDYRLVARVLALRLARHYEKKQV